MFRALLCPSSGARDCDVDYRIGRIVLSLLYVGGKPATRTLLQPNCTLPPAYSKPRTKRPLW